MTALPKLQQYLLARPALRDVPTICKNFGRGVTVAEVRQAIASLAKSPPTAQPARKLARPVRALREEFDDIGKVRKFMRTLGASEYVDDEELRSQLRISHPRWREVRSHPSLSEYQFLLPTKKVVWMHKEAQAQLRSAIDLSRE